MSLGFHVIVVAIDSEIQRLFRRRREVHRGRGRTEQQRRSSRYDTRCQFNRAHFTQACIMTAIPNWPSFAEIAKLTRIPAKIGWVPKYRQIKDSSFFKSAMTVGLPHQFRYISMNDNGRVSGIPYSAHVKVQFCLARRIKAVRFLAAHYT